ncbi:MAG: amino acid carrier protein [Coriobacteriales bacterium]|jgi:AGCS family alanine or glycine:cation symporter|nr:amino acid carrier protein [Coriobacteriales bacterium]
MDPIAAINGVINDVDTFVWGIPLIVILVVTHLWTTIRTGFIQRKLPTAIKLSVTKDPDSQGDVSQFGALMTALSATIGTGNIVGVATGIVSGGPGAVFWMWIIGFFGIATKYSETYMSVRYRVKDHKGTMLGGAMYAWRRHFTRDANGRRGSVTGKTPWWAMLGAGAFALLAGIASFGIGAAVQSSACASIIASNIPVLNTILGPNTFLGDTSGTLFIGILIVILTALVLIGGIKAIAKVCEVMVPFMAIFYVVGCIVVICFNWAFFIPAIQTIVVAAFNPHAVMGGGLGFTIGLALQFGAKRGLFSNESGLGSAPLVAASATTRNPARQALVSMTGTFWDTVVICAITGITLVSTMLNPNNAALLNNYIGGAYVSSGQALTTAAFQTIPWHIGTIVLVVGMAVFAFSTVLGWAYYGNRCVSYLFGKRAVIPYYVLYVVVAFIGAIGIGQMVWNISDITNALMAIPNVICVWLLGGLIWRGTKHYVYEGNLNEKFAEEIPTVATK